MKITSAVYLTSSVSLDGCPETQLPECAVIGRSNVGKSSLINLLTGQPSLARVSSKPGHTQMINYFTINKAWHLVDLPGYGYAKVSKDKRNKFTTFITDYLLGRDNLRATFVLIDGSLPPQQIDLDFTHWLIGGRVPFVLVFTKADKVSPQRLEENIQHFTTAMKDFCDNSPMIFTASSRKRTGQQELLHYIRQLISH
jgi:GTP-binding protein